MALIVETRGLTRKFGPFTAVDSLSVGVEEGEIFGLLGPNGAGKTTTIKMLTTLLPPTSGYARVADLDVTKRPAEIRRYIGYVPQAISADGTLTGYENLLIFAKLYGIPRHEREERISSSLALMGLSDAADKLVREYSGGMIRRLEIAQSVLHRPRLLFLDEPTVGLDPLAREMVWRHIRRLRDDYGTTMILTTHFMDEADKLCGTVTIMHRGEAVVSGSPALLRAGIGPDATLDDVFIHHTGSELETGGAYRDAARTRRTARRLG